MPDLEPISKEQLYTENAQLKEQVTHLQFQLAQVNRLLFGQKRERFTPTEQARQATLFTIQDDNGTSCDNQENESIETPNVPIKKKKGQIAGKLNPNHKGCNEFPAHLPRMVEILTPIIVANSLRHGYQRLNYCGLD